MATLEPKERRFVNEYLADQNGTQAAIRAGYSRRSARQLAARLLSKDDIRTEIDAKLKRIEEKSELTAEKVFKTALALLTFDPRKALEDDGTIKSIEEMPEEVAMAITGIDVDDEEGEIKKLRFSDRARAVEIGAKLLGILRLEITGKGGVPLVPIPPIDFSGITREDLRRIAGMRPANGNGDSH